MYCNIVYALHIRPVVLCKINCLHTCGYSHMVVYTYDDATHCVGIVSFAINFAVLYCTRFSPEMDFYKCYDHCVQYTVVTHHVVVFILALS